MLRSRQPNPFARPSYCIPEGRSGRRAPSSSQNLWPKVCPLVDSKFTRLIFSEHFLGRISSTVDGCSCGRVELLRVFVVRVALNGEMVVAWWVLLLVLVARLNADITYVPCVDDDSLSTAEQKNLIVRAISFCFCLFQFFQDCQSVYKQWKN